MTYSLIFKGIKCALLSSGSLRIEQWNHAKE